MKKALSIILGVILCFTLTTINVSAADTSLNSLFKDISFTKRDGISVQVDKGFSLGRDGSGLSVHDKDTVTISPHGVSYDGFFGFPSHGFHKSVSVGFPWTNSDTTPDTDDGDDSDAGQDTDQDAGDNIHPSDNTGSDSEKEDNPSIIAFPTFSGVSVEKDVTLGKPVMLTPCISLITLDGKPLSLSVYTYIDANGRATNFVMLRDIAYILSGTSVQFDIKWSKETGIIVIPGKFYSKVGGELATKGQNVKSGIGKQVSIKVKDKCYKTEAYNIDDNNYVKLRDIAKIIGFNVSWCNHTQTVLINSSQTYNEK